MKLAFLHDVFERSGPFATAYVDTSGDAEDAAKAVELRWRSARESLQQQGADEPTLRAIADWVAEHDWRSGQRGQVIVASEGEVVFHDELPQPPANDDDKARFGPVPHLLPYLRWRAARLPHVIALVDRIGADITLVSAGQKDETTTVEGSDHPVHKAPAGETQDERRMQNAVEENRRGNAEQVAAEVTKQAKRIGAEAVVLAGDVQQRQLVHEAIGGEVHQRVVQAESGNRDHASKGPLSDEVADVVQSAVRARVDETVQEFEHQRGQNDRAVHGWERTVGALQRGQVESLLLALESLNAESIPVAHVGPAANEIALDERSLEEMGVQDAQRVDGADAVLRALVGTQAALVLVDPEKVELDGGIGAVLRYSDNG